MDLSTREGRRKQGERIKRAAKEAGLSLDELAIKIGCSRALIFQYVSGALLAQPNRLQMIGNVVGKPLPYFFAEEEEPAPVAVASTTETVDDSRWIRERVSHLRKLLDAYSSAPDPRQIADVCQQIVALVEHEGDTKVIAEILFKHSEALIQLQDFGAAKAKLQEAGSLFREIGWPNSALSCLQSLGHVNVQLGRTEEALKQFEEVAQGTHWQHRWQGKLSMGAAHEVLGNYTQAAELFMNATEIVEENSNPAETETALLFIDSNWANLELDWGEYTRAADRADRCVALAQRLGIQDQYVEAKLTRAIALLELYDVKAALAEARTAMDVAQLLRDHPRRSIALSYRSRCLSATLKPSEAVIDAKEALTLALRTGANRAEVLAQHAIVEAYLTAGNYSEARYHLDQGISVADTQGLRLQQAQFTILRSRLAMGTGNTKEAGELALAALKIADELEAKPVRIDAHLTLARAGVVQERWDDAKNHAQIAAALAADIRTPASAWNANGHLAAAQWKLGSLDEARAAFEIALGNLTDCRWRFTEAVGLDSYFETPGAAELIRTWIGFLNETGRSEEAIEQAEALAWPAVQRFHQREKKPRHEIYQDE